MEVVWKMGKRRQKRSSDGVSLAERHAEVCVNMCMSVYEIPKQLLPYRVQFPKTRP